MQVCRDIIQKPPYSEPNAQPFPKRGKNFFSPSDALIKLDFRCWLGGIPFGIISCLCGSRCQLRSQNFLSSHSGGTRHFHFGGYLLPPERTSPPRRLCRCGYVFCHIRVSDYQNESHENRDIFFIRFQIL